MTKKTIFTRAILSLAISASLALTAVSAAEKNIILDESIHDYSYDASRNLQASPSRQSGKGYDVRILLDKAYHDYNSADVAAFNSKDSVTESAEFAAFEEYSSSMSPKSSSSAIPWVSQTN